MVRLWSGVMLILVSMFRNMLNINACKAAVRDADANRVSLAHLFASDSAAQTFDNNAESTDRRYSTLSDFYACMDKRNDPTFKSPYHSYVRDGNATVFNSAKNNVLVTDGKAMAEPAQQNAFNLKNGPINNLGGNNPGLDAGFESALNNALANSSANFSGSYRNSVLCISAG